MKCVLPFGFVLMMIAFISCDREGSGTVSFGSNYSLMNCIVESVVYIDDVQVGNIPEYCDSVVNCSGEKTLNVEVSEGEHSYRIEIVSAEGSCYKESTGEFSVSDGECVTIFFDIQNEISAEVVTRELVVFPEDSIYLQFELNLHVEKEPYSLQWILPETYTGTGPFTVGLREDKLLNVRIIDSENQHHDLKHTILRDTIDPLKYDYREEYCGVYIGECFDHDGLHYNPPRDTVYIDTVTISKHDEFSMLSWGNNSKIWFYYKSKSFSWDRGSGSFYGVDSMKYRYYSGPDGSIPLNGSFKGKKINAQIQ